jgi:hypothetical protein
MTTRLRGGKDSGVDFRTNQSDFNSTKGMSLIRGFWGGMLEDVIGAAPVMDVFAVASKRGQACYSCKDDAVSYTGREHSADVATHLTRGRSSRLLH